MTPIQSNRAIARLPWIKATSMESRNHYHGIHPYAVSTVRHHARKLARSPAFLPADVEDIEQELMLDLFQNLPRHNPGKASISTFMAKLVENHALILVEHVQTVKRGGNARVTSLQELVTADEGCEVELGETIPSSATLWNYGELSSFDAAELRVDVAHALRNLPPSLQGITSRLMMETFTEISVATGIPRSSLYDAASRIRTCFMKDGLGKNLQRCPTN